MAAIDLAREYISRVNGRDGEGVARLFAEDGVIVDAMGREHAGREEIARFVSAAPPNTIAHIADRHMGTSQVVFRGTVETGHLPPAEVEWVFEVDNGFIKRLSIRLLNGRHPSRATSTGRR